VVYNDAQVQVSSQLRSYGLLFFTRSPLWSFRRNNYSLRSQDSSVCTATGYGLDGRGAVPGRGKTFFSTPQPLNQLWGPPSLLSNGYRGVWPFPQGMKLITHFHLAPRSRMVEQYLHYPHVSMAWCLIKHRDNNNSQHGTHRLPEGFISHNLVFTLSVQ
jgi:hypothetical protein